LAANLDLRRDRVSDSLVRLRRSLARTGYHTAPNADDALEACVSVATHSTGLSITDRERRIASDTIASGVERARCIRANYQSPPRPARRGEELATSPRIDWSRLLQRTLAIDVS
jgi:hypothetical protein